MKPSPQARSPSKSISRLAKTERECSDLTELQQIKLYNAGSFFDAQAIPEDEEAVISKRLAKFSRVIVESHPALIGDRCLRFRDRLNGQLEIALGLETVHPEALVKLNKRVSLEQFRDAADFITRHEIALRTFVLLQPPFIPVDESVEWAKRSIDFSQDCGATVTALIPTRTGNGAMDRLAAVGQFIEPTLVQLEDTMDYGVGQARGRVFADLWDLERFLKLHGLLPPTPQPFDQTERHPANPRQDHLPKLPLTPMSMQLSLRAGHGI